MLSEPLTSANERRGHHVVQFYEEDAFGLDSTATFLASGIHRGEAIVAIGTRPHREALQVRLRARGIDLAALRRSGAYVALDAEDTLSRFMVEGWPDEARFAASVGRAIEQAMASSRGRGVRAFGEMVALLWADGRRDAAVRLEELWNRLVSERDLSLLCIYPLAGFGSADDAQAFARVCEHHSSVLPAESFPAGGTPDHRDRVIAELQQRSLALEAEISERRELATRLAENDRLKDEFLATLAHELRNPLAPIAMALALVRSRSEARDCGRYLDLIERQTHNLSRLVDDLLDVSRITRGRIVLRKERVDVAAVVARAVDATHDLVEHRSHVLATELDEGLIVVADPLRLEQVLVNLLTNAAKYTPPGGTLTVSAVRIPGRVEIRVRDSGVGISPDLLPRVFDLFQQAERTLDRAQGGLGVGLTVARKLVEMHDGSIEAQSDGVGRGSEFVVHLPLARAAAEPSDGARDRRDATASARGLRVLVVDDNGDAREVLAELLRAHGHEVRTAADGPAALRLAAELRPAMVLLDIGMPGMDGLEVANRLRRDGSTALLVAVSGYGQQRDRHATAAAGFWRHLVKPVLVDALERLLAEVTVELGRRGGPARVPAA